MANKELRCLRQDEIMVGNYMTDEWASDSAMFQVISAGSRIITFGAKFRVRYNHARPIVLSPAVLEKFGFLRTVHMAGKRNPKVEYIDYRLKQFVLYCLPSGFTEVEFYPEHETIEDRGYIGAFEFVHEFQNLYKLLTKRDLILADPS